MPDVTDSLESIDRRVGRLERTLENGPYVRKDVWYEVVGSLREDLAGLRSDIGMITLFPYTTLFRSRKSVV